MNNSSHTVKTAYLTNLLAAWYGQLIGDAYGSTYEFSSPLTYIRSEAIKLIGGGPFSWKPGQVTDDSQMATGIAKMYLRAGSYNRAIHREEMLAWINSSPPDVGSWTRQALSAWSRSGIVNATSNNVEKHPVYRLWKDGGADNAGNGGPMKCVPTLLANPRTWSRISETKKICEDTHPDPRCWLGSIYVVEMANELALGYAPDVAHHTACIRVLKAADLYKADGRYTDLVLNALEGTGRVAWQHWNNGGYVIPTIRTVSAAVRQADSFEHGLRMVISRGGDTDTVGAIAGVLLGARFGIGSEKGVDLGLVRQLHDQSLPGLGESLLKLRNTRMVSARLRAKKIWPRGDLALSFIRDSSACCLLSVSQAS